MICDRKDAEDTMRYAEDGIHRVERLKARHDQQFTQYFYGQPTCTSASKQCDPTLRAPNFVATIEVSLFAAGIVIVVAMRRIRRRPSEVNVCCEIPNTALKSYPSILKKTVESLTRIPPSSTSNFRSRATQLQGGYAAKHGEKSGTILPSVTSVICFYICFYRVFGFVSFS